VHNICRLQIALISFLGGYASSTHAVITVVILMKNNYLEELLEKTSILYLFSIGSYVWFVGI
jgi:hypothetical protein